MVTLSIDSERFPATGAISGAGLQKLLGAPSLNLLQTVVREAVQNSVDAKREGLSAKVQFHCRQLTTRQVGALRDRVFASLPPKGGSGDAIRRFLSEDSPWVLEISDFGSSGLGGPTRADQVKEGMSDTNFVDFLRNVGVDRNTTLGGGTYGYGKVSLYRASKCSTIIVDTRTTESGKASRRLMACHLGDSYSLTARGRLSRYTGRHWWGVRNRTIVDPLEGAEAATLADKLGFSQRSPEQTGTSILILGPNVDGDAESSGELEQAAAEIVKTLLWNYWPRMMRNIPEERKVEFKVLVNDMAIDVPQPEDVPPLGIYCAAMTNLLNQEGDVRDLAYRGSSRVLGRLSLVKRLYQPSVFRSGSEHVSNAAQRSSHIALMRPVDFVVKYLKGPPLQDSRLEWAGVFRASDQEEVERAFADAEPPAHDDWMPDSISDKRRKSWVNVAMRDLQRIASEFPNDGQTAAPSGGAGVPLGELAQQLGSILPSNFGEGAGPRPSGQSKPRGAPRAHRVSRPEFEKLEEVEGGTLAWFKLEFAGLKPPSAFHIELTPLSSTDGGGSIQAEDSIGLDLPTIHKIIDVGAKIEHVGEVLVPQSPDGELWVAVRLPAFSAVILKATVVRAPRQ